MTVCYVHGDGLGHLTRLRAYLHTTGQDGPVTVLTGSPFADDPRVGGDWRVLRAPADGTDLQGWTARTLARLAPRELIVDAFPCGAKGELDASVVPSGTRVTHLARILRWDSYRPLVPATPPRLDRTFVLEPLAAEHEAFLRSVSGEVAPLELVDPPAAPAERAPDGWLIVHAGTDAEILELVGYARDIASSEGVRPRMTLVAPRRPEGLAPAIGHLDAYPAWPLAAHADMILTAAGFNTVRQFAPWQDRHRVIPFPRSLDDQFARAARTRR